MRGLCSHLCAAFFSFVPCPVNPSYLSSISDICPSAQQDFCALLCLHLLVAQFRKVPQAESEVKCAAHLMCLPSLENQSYVLPVFDVCKQFSQNSVQFCSCLQRKIKSDVNYYLMGKRSFDLWTFYYLTTTLYYEMIVIGIYKNIFSTFIIFLFQEDTYFLSFVVYFFHIFSMKDIVKNKFRKVIQKLLEGQ